MGGVWLAPGAGLRRFGLASRALEGQADANNTPIAFVPAPGPRGPASKTNTNSIRYLCSREHTVDTDVCGG